MIISEDKTDAKLVGSKRSQHYTLQASAAVFDSMFRNLYSFPIESIVREIYTNAMEVTPSPDKAPWIWLPNNLEPSFAVRDFGPGMSEEFIFSVYTQGGASTKRETNDAIGGFGFGSKSGFAYSDSFTVTSWHQGVKTIYLMYRDDLRIPSVSKVNSSPSDEPSGIEFRIASKTGDHSRWYEAASKQLRCMPILPIIKNNKNFEFEPLHEALLEHENIKYIGGNNLYVRMGGPIYEITPSAVTYLNPDFKGLWIDAPIGSVDLTPSREALNFSPKTLAYLESQHAKIKAVMQAKLQAKIDACKNNKEAALLHKELFDWQAGSLVRSCKIANYRGQPIKWEYKLSPTLKNGVELYPHVGRQESFQWGKIPISSDTIFIVTPGVTMHRIKLRQWEDDNPNKIVKVLKYDDDTLPMLPTHLKELEDFEIVLASDLPKPASKIKSVRPPNSYSILLRHPSTWGIRHKQATSGLYVIGDHKIPELLQLEENIPPTRVTALNHLMAKLYSHHQVVVIPLGKLKKFLQDKTGWVSLKEQLQTDINNHEIFKLKLRPATSATTIYKKFHHPQPPFLRAFADDLVRFIDTSAKFSDDYCPEPPHLADLKKVVAAVGLTCPVNPTISSSPEWINLLAWQDKIEKDPLLKDYVEFNDWRSTATLDEASARKLVSYFERK